MPGSDPCCRTPAQQQGQQGQRAGPRVQAPARSRSPGPCRLSTPANYRYSRHIQSRRFFVALSPAQILLVQQACISTDIHNPCHGRAPLSHDKVASTPWQCAVAWWALSTLPSPVADPAVHHSPCYLPLLVGRGRSTGAECRQQHICVPGLRQGLHVGSTPLLPTGDSHRFAMTRQVRRGGKIWIRLFPDKPAKAPSRPPGLLPSRSQALTASHAHSPGDGLRNLSHLQRNC
jgi:hypothetical protein